LVFPCRTGEKFTWLMAKNRKALNSKPFYFPKTVFNQTNQPKRIKMILAQPLNFRQISAKFPDFALSVLITCPFSLLFTLENIL